MFENRSLSRANLFKRVWYEKKQIQVISVNAAANQIGIIVLIIRVENRVTKLFEILYSKNIVNIKWK